MIAFDGEEKKRFRKEADFYTHEKHHFDGHLGTSGLDWSTERWVFLFDNGYGASVIRGSHTYGGPAGFYELAVTHADQLCYDTEITSDVMGWLTQSEVNDLLDRIEELPPRIVAKTDIEEDFPVSNH